MPSLELGYRRGSSRREEAGMLIWMEPLEQE